VGGVSDWVLRAARPSGFAVYHPSDLPMLDRCSECHARVGYWLEHDEVGRRIAKPCGHEQTACLLPPWRWRIGESIPLVWANGTAS
jgi:hypothetical protein